MINCPDKPFCNTGIQILDQMDMYLFLKNYFLLKYQSIMHKNNNANVHDKCTFFYYNLYEPMEIKCMDTYMHKTMASVASLEKIEIIRSEELCRAKQG